VWSEIESEQGVRSYRFSVMFDVHPAHVAYDDPGWAADAAHGALTNVYGIEAVYGPIRLIADQ
jgi:hypothetical protein